MHVAALNRIKDQPTLLAAMALLKQRGVPFGLAIVGLDTLDGEMQRLAARLGLADVEESLFPDAKAIAEWGWPHLAAGEGLPAADAQPLYVRHRVALTTAERVAGLRL
jgi:tRNA A37 threonylcarbamoyladenosine modification protein TsaB